MVRPLTLDRVPVKSNAVMPAIILSESGRASKSGIGLRRVRVRVEVVVWLNIVTGVMA